MNDWVSKMPWHVRGPSQACSEAATVQGAARAVGVSQHCLWQGTTSTAQANRFPASLHGIAKAIAKPQVWGISARRESRKTAGVCDFLAATALSPVRRWSHSLDPMRISGKQKSFCSPLLLPGGGQWQVDPKGLEICSVTPE